MYFEECVYGKSFILLDLYSSSLKMRTACYNNQDFGK